MKLKINPMVLFVGVSTLSFIFLYSCQPDNWKDKMFLFHLLLILSLASGSFFLHLYSSLWSSFTLMSLKELDHSANRGWSGFVNRNFLHLVTLLIVSAPMVLVAFALIRGLSFYLPALAAAFPFMAMLLAVYGLALLFILLSLVLDAIKVFRKMA